MGTGTNMGRNGIVIDELGNGISDQARVQREGLGTRKRISGDN